MRHRKHSVKLGRTSSHRRAMFANMLKSLIDHESIQTTPEKAKELRRYADQMITLAKKGDLAARRRAAAALQVRYNPLSAREARQARSGNLSAYNTDRRVVRKLFEELGPRFTDRQGGYTRVVRLGIHRFGDAAEKALIEFVSG